eukprot:1776804-Pyramimonas_sp.AAC.1
MRLHAAGLAGLRLAIRARLLRGQEGRHAAAGPGWPRSLEPPLTRPWARLGLLPASTCRPRRYAARA